MPEIKEAPTPQLSVNDLKEIEYVSRTFHASVDGSVTERQLLDPQFWAHHAQKMAPWNEVKACAKDGSWMAHMLVLDVSRTWAKLKMLHFYRLTTADVSLTQASDLEVQAAKAKYVVKHRGVHKWSVVRVDDSAVMHEGEQIKDDAQAKLDAIATADVRGGVALQT